MRKSTVVAIGSITVALLVMSSNIAFASSNKKHGNGIPQEIASMQSQITSLQSTVAAQSKEIASQKSDITSLQTTVSRQSKELKQQASELSSQKSAIDKLQSEVAPMAYTNMAKEFEAKMQTTIKFLFSTGVSNKFYPTQAYRSAYYNQIFLKVFTPAYKKLQAHSILIPHSVWSQVQGEYESLDRLLTKNTTIGWGYIPTHDELGVPLLQGKSDPQLPPS